MFAFPQTKEDPSVAVFVWHTESKTLTLIKEFAPGREEVAHGVVAGLYERSKHDSPLQAAKYEVSVVGVVCFLRRITVALRANRSTPVSHCLRRDGCALKPATSFTAALPPSVSHLLLFLLQFACPDYAARRRGSSDWGDVARSL